jgi:hypothetical protein
MEINSELYSEITSYCDLNEIKDVDGFISGLLKKAFLIEKYGAAPPITVKPVLPVKEEPTVIEKPIIEEPKIEPKIEPEIIKTNKDIYGE